MFFSVTQKFFFIILCCFVLHGCKTEESKSYEWKTIEVTATAYNSLKSQTDSDPIITAFGDSLKPGMRCIAVSRDLLKKGLKHHTLVKIENLEGSYLVNDKMNKRWKNKIDIYMGIDVEAAKQWGRRKVNISYLVEVNEDTATN